MKKTEFTFQSSGKLADIRAVKYEPEKSVRAVLQIAHGMDEFIDRYDGFAEYLCDKGFLVVGNDHLGHGGSVKSKDDWGYFGENGNQVLLDDMYKLTEAVKKEYADVPYFLLGHSMGSFYARQYIAEHGDALDGAISMGTGVEPEYKLKAAMLMCRTIALFKGWRHRSNLVNSLAFGAYNKRFEPARTPSDWLTKDEKIVDWYRNEPRCTFVFTLNGYYNMFTGILRLHDKELMNRVPKDLPLLFVSGQEDPVGSFGKEVEASVEYMKDLGIRDVRLKLYQNDRHEILNETDKETVYEDLYVWLNEMINKK
ncbi:MAG: alpha/beta fold hydrolase [Erysipelotrichaceae bacterium]|nr:alpha/beta fold hydrolase [Erysipelotrichaceae bacterium]